MQNRTKYEFAVDRCLKLLKSRHRYYDLTIDDANYISTFSEADWCGASSVDLRHGSYMFNDPKN